MGEYADDSIEREWNEMLDEIEDGDIDDSSFIRGGIAYTIFEFKSIKKETEKAWCIIMTGGAERWYPKSKCIVNGDMIAIPNWLKDKIMETELAKAGFI